MVSAETKNGVPLRLSLRLHASFPLTRARSGLQNKFEVCKAGLDRVVTERDEARKIASALKSDLREAKVIIITMFYCYCLPVNNGITNNTLCAQLSGHAGHALARPAPETARGHRGSRPVEDQDGGHLGFECEAYGEQQLAR